MKFVTAKTPLAAAVGLMVATSVWAKVPANEAEQLGKELTCVGAIKAGNNTVEFVLASGHRARFQNGRATHVWL